MASYELLSPLLIGREGGEVNNKSDYGGLTKYGVSQREYPRIDIASLTEAQALLILKEGFWDRYQLGNLNDQAIANQCFFLLINMNPEHAAEIIQRAINACGRSVIAVTVDGIFGSATIKALNSIAQYWLGDRIRLEQCRYYLNRVDDDLSQEVNFRGWIRRALM